MPYLPGDTSPTVSVTEAPLGTSIEVERGVGETMPAVSELKQRMLGALASAVNVIESPEAKGTEGVSTPRDPGIL